MKTKEEILNAIKAGKKVYWKNTGYQVIISFGELYVYYKPNGFMTYLQEQECGSCFSDDTERASI